MSIPIRQAALLFARPAHHSLMLHWLTHLGALGLFSVAVVDSSFIPLPLPGSTDLLLLWLVAHGRDPWLLAALAIAGSLVGGYATWDLGRRGGEAALHRHVPARFLKRITGWVERHRILAVFLPAVLPPPIPFLPFALAAGALGVSRPRFMAVYACGSNSALLRNCLARRGLRTPRHPHVVRDAPEMVDSADLCVRGPAGGRHLLWNLEGERPSQERCC